MTKLAILSDIHGNLPALEAVLSDLKNFAVDQIVVAGDVINFGPFSNQTTEIVIKNNWPVIRGNNEYFLLDSNTPRAPAEWSDPILFAPTLWTIQHFDLHLKSIIICGHTHLPMDRKSGRWQIFNPGSVGVPLDGILSASYMILEGDKQGWRPTFRRIPFNYDAIYAEFEESGFNKGCGPIGRLVVELYKRARPTFGFLKWWEIHRPNSNLTFELVDEFFKTDDWWNFMQPAYHVNLE